MAGESDDIVPAAVRSEVHGRVCSHMEFHSIKEDESCINPSLVRIPFLVGHVVGMIRFVVGRCPRRQCHRFSCEENSVRVEQVQHVSAPPHRCPYNKGS